LEDVAFFRLGRRAVHFSSSLKTTQPLGYSLFNLQDRGTMFMGPAEDVYAGQIVGLHARENDFTLEQAIEFINDNEYVEITPKSIRIRKLELEHNKRKKK
jgi:GTP-binding protein